jgi:hypothetical protein
MRVQLFILPPCLSSLQNLLHTESIQQRHLGGKCIGPVGKTYTATAVPQILGRQTDLSLVNFYLYLDKKSTDLIPTLIIT